MGAWSMDVRQAVRSLGRQPGFAALTILTLALGVGATLAIFTVVEAILLRPLELPDPDRLVSLCEDNPSVAGYCVASPPDLHDWRAAAPGFTDMGMARGWSFAVRAGGERVSLRGGIGTPGFFRTLGVAPVLGRLFQEEEQVGGPAPVALLSEAAWRTRFGADPAIVGRRLDVDGVPVEVVGVVPLDLEIPDLAGVELWRPLHFDPRDEEYRVWRGFQAVGRMADGTSLGRAREELAAVQTGLAAAHPDVVEGWTVRVEPLKERVVGSARTPVLVFFGAVVVVLLVACANVASLLLARGARRHRELAVRAALGAGRGALARHLLTEALVVALLGSAAGAVLATWLTEVFVALAPAGIPRLDTVAPGAPLVAGAVALTFACALLLGVVPALRAARTDLAGAVKEQRHGPGRGVARLMQGLVVAEVALAVALVVGGGLLLRSMAGLTRWDPGFDPARILTVSAFASPEKHATKAEVAVLWREGAAAVAALPGVEAVATASAGPLYGGLERESYDPGDGTVTDAATAPALRWYDAGPGYFATLGVPVLEGRDFSPVDRGEGVRAGIVNETLARRHWPVGEAVGKRIRLLEFGGEVEVVGVVADVPAFEPGAPVEPQLWWSDGQEPRWATFFTVRTTAGAPAEVRQALTQRLQELDPDLQLGTPRTVAELGALRRVRPRFNTALLGAFALVTLLLAGVGLYGTLAWAVAVRRRDIGVRMALGAGTGRVLRETLAGAGRMAALGGVLGLAGGALFARTLRTLTPGVTAGDPLTYAGAATVLALVALAAAVLPARRASRVDPLVAMRTE